MIARILRYNIVSLWVSWQFFDAPKKILKAWLNFLKFNINYFSIQVLLKTLFSPWHRYRMFYGKRFDPWHYFETFVFNTMSRSIGAILRLFFIFFGLLTEVLIVFAGGAVFLGWLALPLIFVILFLFFLWAIFSNRALGFGSLLIGFVAALFYARAFLEQKFKGPRNSFSFAAAKAISKAKENSSRLFYFLLEESPKLNFVFNRVLLNLSEIKETLRYQVQLLKEAKFEETLSADFQNSLNEAKKRAQLKGREIINSGDILSALAKTDPIFKQILIQHNLKAEDIEHLVSWLESLEEKIAENKKFWEWKNLIKRGSLAKTWTAGYTLTLDKFSVDLTEKARLAGFPEVVGHKEEISHMERVLARTEINNVLVVGEPGSGRKSMVLALAEKAALGESLPEINYKRVVQLDLISLLAQIQSPEEVETILDIIFQEVVLAGNVILVIDEFHNFVSGAVKPGTVDISGVISKYLHLPQFQLVAITTFEGLHRNIEQNTSILALFEKVNVSEISEDETLILLEKLVLTLEYKHKKLFISYPALRDIISLSAKYLPAIPFPEKAMELLDEVVVHVVQKKDKIVLPEHVAKVVRDKTKIPVGEIEAKEREILLNLEELIHKRIINQEEAVKEVSTALRRARAEVTIRKGPMGAFLFLGPTGVGKTETSKALAEIYFGSEQRMIRLDMSEFQNIGDIARLIGAPGQEGLLTTPVRESPFSLVLLDEFEKAHPNILNLFLQVFDEGHLTDGAGRKVDFKNSIIIATSNAGYQIILQVLKELTETGRFEPDREVGRSPEVWAVTKKRLLDYIFSQGIFRPELINRFDAVVVFKPLSKENLLDIAELLLQKLKKNLLEKGIDFLITQSLKEKIVELGFDPKFGAREMRRVIQDKVENVLAKAILSEELRRGGRAQIDPSTFQLKINP